MSSAITVLLLVAATSVAMAVAAVRTEIAHRLGVPDERVYAVVRYRTPLMCAAAIAFVVALIYGSSAHVLSAGAAAAATIVFATSTVAALFVMPRVFPADLKHPRFVSIDTALLHLPLDEDVFVAEMAGEAKAFPRSWVMRPHVVDTQLGGNSVSMTYCALSHSGVAYQQDYPRQIRPITQTQNNLILEIPQTGRLFEQISGRAAEVDTAGDQKLRPLPTQVMPLRSFRDLYPSGSVYFNPPSSWFDNLIQRKVTTLLARQYTDDRPVYETLRREDARLPMKTMVWGIERNGDSVAWTLDYLRRHPQLIVQIGGDRIVVRYDHNLDTVSAFDVADCADAIALSADTMGNANGHRLARIPVHSKVLWMVWANFYPDTRLHDGEIGSHTTTTKENP